MKSVLNGESIDLSKKKKIGRKMGIFSCIFKDLLNALKYNVEHTLAVLLKIKMTKTTMLTKIIKYNACDVKSFVIHMVKLAKSLPVCDILEISDMYWHILKINKNVC